MQAIYTLLTTTEADLAARVASRHGGWVAVGVFPNGDRFYEVKVWGECTTVHLPTSTTASEEEAA